MKVYTTLCIGEYHLNYCEDYLFTGSINSRWNVAAVMDGCTMGEDSYFVATLIGKVLRKITTHLDYTAFYDKRLIDTTPRCLMHHYLQELFRELKHIKSHLMLRKEELLATLTLVLIDQTNDTGLILVVGDGVVAINGQVIEIEQDNKPDYLGYHLEQDFEDWYEKQQQWFPIEQVKDISIATDGITSFQRYTTAPPASVNPAAFLLEDKEGYSSAEMLNRKLKQLEHEYGLKPTDDVAMVRLINDTA